jgi:hypothetical protein
MPIAFTCPHCGHQTDVAEEYAGQSGPCIACGNRVTMPLPGQPGYGVESPSASPGGKRSTGVVGGLLALLAIGLCLCCGGGLFLSIFWPSIQGAREAARRNQCAANLQRIGVAMQSYYADFGCFPPAYLADSKGRPQHSWRALLLPYLDPPLAAQYRLDEPWDGPNNSLLTSRIPAVYRCPSDSLSDQSNTTDYVVINGGGAIFDGPKCTKASEITDGTGSTLLVVEIVDSGIVWLEPRDLRIEQLVGGVNAADEVSSNHPAGANVLTADGKVHFIAEGRSGGEVQALATKAGGEPVNPP